MKFSTKIRWHALTLLQGTFVPLTDPQFNKQGKNLAPFLTQAFEAGSIAGVANAAFRAAITIGAMIAVLRIAYAGFIYMTSDIWSSKSSAKEILQNSLLGLLLLLAIYLILEQINPNILNLNLLQNTSQTSSQTILPSNTLQSGQQFLDQQGYVSPAGFTNTPQGPGGPSAINPSAFDANAPQNLPTYQYPTN